MVKIANSFLLDLASPKNLLWWWNFGFTLGTSIIIQAPSGLMLALSYCDSLNYASFSVQHTTDEIERGRISRFIHPRGARVLFFSIFTHVGRRIWFKSYFIKEVWMTGVVIFLILIMVSFIGHVLPWGQISFWAATAITNLLHVSPYMGKESLEWAWGGSRVGGSTLSRFSIPHHIPPSVTLILRPAHLVYLHVEGRRNPVGLSSGLEKVEFYWYFMLKDLVFFIFFVPTPSLTIMPIPFIFMDVENFLVVDSIKTPEHIKPEWHSLSAYRTLRSVPNKVGGVIGLVIRTSILFLTPHTKILKLKLVDLYVLIINIILFLSSTILTWLGGCIVEWPFNSIGMIVSLIYLAMTLQLIFLFRKQSYNWFIRIIFLLLVVVWLAFWFDLMKILIFLEFFRIMVILIIISCIAELYYTNNFFVIILVFLVCEPRVGFFIIIYFLRTNYEIVRKLSMLEL